MILGTTPYGQKALRHFLKPPSLTHDIAKDFAWCGKISTGPLRFDEKLSLGRERVQHVLVCTA